jgi:dipicolinate synthase subunit A
MQSIGIIGGDLRQVYMANQLADQGHDVYIYGMIDHYLLAQCKQVSSLSQLVHQSNLIIGPIPLTSNKTTIHTITTAPSDFTLEELKKQLQETIGNQPLLLAGMIPDALREWLSCIGISYYDFMKDDNIACANAVATAEGAIAMAVEKSSGNIQNSHSLIIGYGKCGKVLAQKVKALNSHVTICARKETVRSEASSYGYTTIDFESLTKTLPTYDYIYNTIPVVILTKERLLSISRDTTIIDIASAPGGIDYPAAKELRLNATLYLGIPGKIAPRASAQILINKLLPLL